MDPTTGVRFPQFLEVQDHIWGYGLMFSGLFIAYSIWKYGWSRYKSWQNDNDVDGFDVGDYVENGVSAFRDDFVNTGDNDWWIGRWWDAIMYIGFPAMFAVLMLSYFGDLLTNVHDPWNPTNPHGISIILLFWGVTAFIFVSLNKYVLVNRMVPTADSPWPLYVLSRDFELEPRPVYRNVPEGAEAPIDMLPGGDDPFVVQAGDELPDSFVDEYGETRSHTMTTVEAELV